MNMEIDYGDTRPAIDLSIYHARHSAGDVHAYMTWTLHNGRPCIVLIPGGARIISHERVIPCIVPADSAHLWDETMGDPGHVARNSMRFAAALGLNQYNPASVLKITVIVRDLLGDLLRMPPMPRDTLAPVAEMEITDNATGKVTEKEVTDHA